MKLYAPYMIIFLLIFNEIQTNQTPFPIQYSIPECKIVKTIPEKTKDFANVIPRGPGDKSAYIYSDEDHYYADYQSSYYALTSKKGGWDCLRHYEILANGCIPYFVDIDQCPPNTMHFLPKDLIKEAMNLDGVSHMHIDHTKFDTQKYHQLLEKILEHTRKHLTSKSIVEYLLKTVNYSGNGKILFISLESRYESEPRAEYMRDLILIGLKEVLHDNVIDVPKIEHVYKDYSKDTRALYGKGFSYTKIIDDIPVDRSDIEKRIQNRDFELIIFACVHDAFKYREYTDLVSKYYQPHEIIYLCKNEGDHKCEYAYQLDNLFIREYNIEPIKN
jgi:hypothetical protein